MLAFEELKANLSAAISVKRNLKEARQNKTGGRDSPAKGLDGWHPPDKGVQRGPQGQGVIAIGRDNGVEIEF